VLLINAFFGLTKEGDRRSAENVASYSKSRNLFFKTGAMRGGYLPACGKGFLSWLLESYQQDMLREICREPIVIAGCISALCQLTDT